MQVLNGLEHFWLCSGAIFLLSFFATKWDWPVHCRSYWGQISNLSHFCPYRDVHLTGVLANTHLSPNYPKLNFDFLLGSCGNTTKSKFTPPILHPQPPNGMRYPWGSPQISVVSSRLLLKNPPFFRQIFISLYMFLYFLKQKSQIWTLL